MFIRQLEARLKRVGLDRYTMLLLLAVVLATLAPARGSFAPLLREITFWAVALLFFLYGARLSTATIAAGLANLRLQASVMLCTFLLFPLFGLLLNALVPLWLPAVIGIGFLYIGCLPSTVQSSIAFTSMSNGNVAGAVCAASISNLIGVFLSPLLFVLLIPQTAGYAVDLTAVVKVVQQILLPFAAGQACRPLLSGFLNRYKMPTMIVDRGSILLIVYAAFSAGVVNGVWLKVSLADLAMLVGFCALLLAAAVGSTVALAKAMQMDRVDRLALLYCGSTKSLATGLPMAGILFPRQDISLVVLPLMLFHLMQLIVCTIVSRRTSPVHPT